MKKTIQLSMTCIAMLFLLLVNGLLAQEATADRSLSPYFMVKSEGKGLDQMPLKSTSATVNIAGVIADVTITQVYKNEGECPIEAIYVFPASSRAAIYGMKMKVGTRTITAEIQEREKARQTYETAKNNGQRTSLLEQERPNVFQMNVANVQPGDEIQVELKYTELIVPTEGEYAFVYPTVVGPRYTNGSESDAKFASMPYLHAKEKPTNSFDLKVWLSAGMPLQDVTCTSHKAQLKYEGTNTVQVSLDPAERQGGNRDFILKYRLAGSEIEDGLLLYETGGEKYFLYMAQPPKRVSMDKIPAREYIFIVDVSGSMHGFPLEVSKKLMRNLLTGLRPTDKFNVMLFAGTSALFAEKSVTATAANIEQGIGFIDSQQGGGGTELLPALQRALNLERDEEGVSRSMVVVTDGFIGLEKAAFDLIRNHLDDANLFAFGIGSSVNNHLVEGLAHVGQGEPAIITKPEEAAIAAERFRKYIQSPVLTRVKASFDGFDAYNVEPASIPDVLAERPVIIFGKYKGEPKGEITLKGFSGKKKFKSSFSVDKAKPDARNTALRYLWARERIRLLDDYNRLDPSDERVKEVTNLGLKYNLMTAYTSFVAVDREIVKNTKGELTEVKQPLPLPEGVEDSAVGFSPAIEGLVLRGVQSGVFGKKMLQAILLVVGLLLVVFGVKRL
jgi:Ca-activated chloride channel family protein